MKYLLFILSLPTFAFANCKEVYISLDFGGRIGDGIKITDYLVQQQVPHVVFMVGYNLKTNEAKELCQKINTDPDYKKYVKVGNHTQSHKGFNPSDTESYINKEIMGNEQLILANCTTNNFVKVFRYPKGQSHEIAERILENNNYSSKYSQYSDEKYKTQMGIGWTSDTRDWVEEGAASLWAQETYYKRHNEFMPVSPSSREEFKNYVLSHPENNSALTKKIQAGELPPIFDKSVHEELDGWHGPSKDAIVKTLLNDKGVNGKCIPLTHFGGFNTFEALKEVIPQLKKEGKVFRLLDDNLDYAVKDLELISNQKNLDLINDVSNGTCHLPDDANTFHIVKSGETLFSIAQKYNSSVEEIKLLNNLVSDSLEIDQKLKILPEKLEHVVVDGETLYRISKIYDVSVDDIKKWNNFESDEIEINQKILIKR